MSRSKRGWRKVDSLLLVLAKIGVKCRGPLKGAAPVTHGLIPHQSITVFSVTQLRGWRVRESNSRRTGVSGRASTPSKLPTTLRSRAERFMERSQRAKLDRGLTTAASARNLHGRVWGSEAGRNEAEQTVADIEKLGCPAIYSPGFLALGNASKAGVAV